MSGLSAVVSDCHNSPLKLSYSRSSSPPPPSILDELQSQLLTIRRGDAKAREAAFLAFQAYGSSRTLMRHIQNRFGRKRAMRCDAGTGSPLLEKASSLVAEKKLSAFANSGRWISTFNALELLINDGLLPNEGLPSESTINHHIAAKHLLEVRRSHEVLQATAPHDLHVADTSGSACFRTVDFNDETMIEATPAMDSAEAKNHPENFGRRRLYLYGIVDSHSGCLWAEYRAGLGPNSWAMADFLLNVWKRSCVPLHLLTDHGAENRGAVDNLVQALGINRMKSKPRHPQSHGVIERCFRTIFQSFEVPLMMKMGIGNRTPLKDLNDLLQGWLMTNYNAAKARLSTTTSVTRYDSSQQGVQLRQVPSSMTVPQVITRSILPIGKGCIRHAGRLYIPENPIQQGSLVSLLVNGDEVLGIAADDGSRIKVTAYQMRTGIEFHEADPANVISAGWAQALIALGIDGKFLDDELGRETHRQLRMRAGAMKPDEVMAMLKEAMP